MAAKDAATILLSGLQWLIRREGLNKGGGAITPGMLVERFNGGFRAHAVSAGANAKSFARRDISQSGGIDDTIPVGSQVAVGFGQSGDQVNAILLPGNSITVLDRLMSDGAGGLVKSEVAAAQASLVVGTADAAVTFVANDLGTNGNDITIEYLAGTAATATVVVTGTAIVIKPDTTTPGTTDQADDIITLVNADAEASVLVTANEGAGDGTSAVVTPFAKTNLAGGIDSSAGDENSVAIALETVADPSTGFARVQVEVL